MNRLNRWLLWVLMALLSSLFPAQSSSTLEAGFNQPPDSTRPWCYWYWISDQISRDGITRDLEAMKRVGIGEAFIGNIFMDDTKPGPVKVLSEEWWGMVEHAIREGSRLGVDIGMFNCPGWSQSGGPWIQSSNAMRRVSWTEQRVGGPGSSSVSLKAPSPDFQPFAVIAFPAPVEDGSRLTAQQAKITCAPALEQLEQLLDGNPETAVMLPPSASQYTIDFASKGPFTLRSLTLEPSRTDFSMKCELQVERNRVFQSLRSFIVDRSNNGVGVGFMPYAPVAITLEPVTARRFRLVCGNIQGKAGLAEVRLSSAARVERYVEKQLGKMHPTPLPTWDTYLWSAAPEPGLPGFAVPASQVLDLTSKLSRDGRLDWQAPAGEWVVLWMGLVPTGTRNAPASPEGQGLEVDKMNRAQVHRHFQEYIGKLLQRMPPRERKAFKHVVADSYEMGSQNWTDGFAERFQKRYGYDPRPWLPVLTGRVVGSAEESERFLWDLRRLVADLVATEYVGGLREDCNKHGLKLWLENYGHWGFPAEFLQYGGRADEVSGEFWATGDLGSIELRCASSAAHTYGKPVVHAEAFTSGQQFEGTPWSLKKRGDWGLTEGINHWVLHVYIHQPWEDRIPGVNAWFSTEFNRHNTWFEQSRSWIDYYRRCGFLLQQGQPVADVAYFIGEDAPKMTGVRQPALPPGFNFDYINAEVIESRLKVKQGRFVLPEGVSYSLLVLPDLKTMRPGLLKKIRDLVRAGGTILGPAPERSPSREGFPKCDQLVRKLAEEVWGDLRSEPARGPLRSRTFGAGRVLLSNDLGEVMPALGLLPDVAGVDPKKILWTHRASAEADIYFLSNQSEEELSISPIFRVSGRTPELWDPVQGRMVSSALYQSAGQGTRVGISLRGGESVFVVFRGSSESKVAATDVMLNGKLLQTLKETKVAVTKPLGGTAEVNVFTMAGWVNPASGIGLPAEATEGVFLHIPRNDAVVPAHGATLSNEPGHVGAGISVGTNGVCVFEHGANYFAPLLAKAIPLQGWQFITVVYEGGRPRLYVNGERVHQGLASRKQVHSGAAIASDSPGFRGKNGGFQTYAGALDHAEVQDLYRLGPPPAFSAILPITLASQTGRKIQAEVATNGIFKIKWTTGQSSDIAVSNIPAPLEISGPWDATFPSGRGMPEKITLQSLAPLETHSDPAVQHFAGTVRYVRKLEIPATFLGAGKRLRLDLGEVNSMADVWLNGKSLGTFWSPPYVVDLTEAAHEGANELLVAVTGTWRNRLIGEAKYRGSPPSTLGANTAFTPFLTTDLKLRGSEALSPFGLVGPVRLLGSEKVNLVIPAP
jgi:hypothetical protein